MFFNFCLFKQYIKKFFFLKLIIGDSLQDTKINCFLFIIYLFIRVRICYKQSSSKAIMFVRLQKITKTTIMSKY